MQRNKYIPRNLPNIVRQQEKKAWYTSESPDVIDYPNSNSELPARESRMIIDNNFQVSLVVVDLNADFFQRAIANIFFSNIGAFHTGVLLQQNNGNFLKNIIIYNY